LDYLALILFFLSCQATSHYLSPAIFIFPTDWLQNFTAKELIVGDTEAVVSIPQRCTKVLKKLRTFAFSSHNNHSCDFEVNFVSSVTKRQARFLKL
jgi:hypothetical protein